MAQFILSKQKQESSPNPFLVKLMEEDVEMYLCTFERTMQREGWPKPKWASLLAPFLSGKAQKASFDLNADQAANYEELKREILSHYGFSLACRAQMFLDWAFHSTLTLR